MELAKFQIKNYKVVADTDSVEVDQRVTALVGKNESGKTAVLKAMWKTRNVAAARFDKLYDYPRDRYSRDRKSSQEVTVLEFSLSSKEAEELGAEVGHVGAAEAASVVYTTFYEGEDQIRQEIDIKDFEPSGTGLEARAIVERLIDAIEEKSSEQEDSVRAACATGLERLEESASLWEATTADALESIDAEISNWISADAARQDMASTEREEFSEIVARARKGDPMEAARAWAEKNLPIFIYFDDYGQLETRIHLPTYLRTAADGSPRTRTQTALFEWSGLDPQEILELGKPQEDGESDDQIHRRQEKRRALLDSASFSLTGDWADWWTEKRHKLHFDTDGENLVLKVSDQHNEFPIPFEERSHGFQWFFSFYLVFLVESKKAHKGAILLLDEPGLHLHPTLQTKLIDLFERISAENQLLYSTHLPFLVDGKHLERVRTVHLDGPEPQKTRVSNDVRPTGDRDTLFPLQAALGYSIAQTLFLGKRSVIVEGITDYWLITTLSACLLTLRSEAVLHEDTILIPAGGTSRLMPLASIMVASTGVGERQLMVLLDSDREGHQAASRMHDLFHGESSVLMLGGALDLGEATIEDLVPRDVYADAVKGSGHEFTLSEDELDAATNVKAMEMVFDRLGLGRFGIAEKAVAALALIDAWGKDASSVPELTRERAAALVEAINSGFDERS